MEDKITYIKMSSKYERSRYEIFKWIKDNTEWHEFDKSFDMSITDGHIFMWEGVWLTTEDALAFKLVFGDWQ